MTDFEVKVFLIIGGLIVVAFILRAYVVPKWDSFYEKYTDSYKLSMKFIEKNKELRDHLGELFEVNSIPNNNYNRGVIIYNFEIIGEKGKGVLTIKMAPKLEWYIYRAILSYGGNEFVIFREKE
jgi:lipopolysaccharide export LptBFGC system permease protein LptF